MRVKILSLSSSACQRAPTKNHLSLHFKAANHLPANPSAGNTAPHCLSRSSTGFFIHSAPSSAVGAGRSQTQPHSINLTANEKRPALLRRTWLEWLAPLPWEWNCTFTFKQWNLGEEAAHRRLKNWIEYLNRSVFGRHWERDPRGGIIWCCAQEYQRRGTIHFHLLAGVQDNLFSLMKLASMNDARLDWNRFAGGTAYITPVRSAKFSVRYAVKHACKGGQVMLSRNLRFSRTMG